MPFWACSRFSASSNTTDCGPSITSSVTSSPRCAGRQCMNNGIRLGPRHEPRVDLIALEQIVPARRRWSPIDTQVSVTTQSAPFTASSGSRADRDRGAGGLDPVDQRLLWRELRRGRDPQAKLEALGGMHPRRQHIVGVAGPRHGAAADRTAMLLERHDVGHHLAGMRTPRQAVDHRHGGVTRKLRDSAS